MSGDVFHGFMPVGSIVYHMYSYFESEVLLINVIISPCILIH